MIRRFVLVSGAALLFLSASLHAQQGTKVLRDDDLVARVNGTPIYRKAVREVVQGVLSVEDSQPGPAAVGKLAEEAMNSLVALELLYQESQARGVKVSDTAVDAEIARSKSQFPDAHAFDQALKAKGITEADLRRDTQKTMAVNQLLERAVWKDVHVNAEQTKDFYEKNREEFKHPAEIRASRILIRVPEGVTESERSTAKQRASAVLAKVQAGADFAQLARENSQDPASAPQGGDLGYFAKGEMDPAFEKQALALSPGQLSGVVTTPYGFEIIKVTDRRGAGYQPFEEVQERIREVLVKSDRQERQADFVARLRQKAKIELLEPAAP
ncbi:MAG: peptidylprolyl isomerase [Candidatus Binatia bacterium]